MSFQRVPGRVSIIVTAYNRARYIRKCLDSLRKQSYNNIEIIIVNDASTDRTSQVIEAWRKSSGVALSRKRRVLEVKMPRNIGFPGAVTTGLFMARGEFIAIQDSDDLSHPKRLEKQVQFLRSHPEVGLVGTNYASFTNGAFNKQEQANWIKYGNDIKETYAAGGHCVCHGTIMFRGSIFDQIGGLTRRMEGAEDYEFIVKFLNNGIPINNIPEVLYYYRAHSLQRSRKYFGKEEDK
ncbi:glycosyltransferase family A protein [Aneurinibacillus thermoaerophilus]|uniref:glycosyltransferase family 2 protein n=1 Tax=Aneurinibacillus thermoaerophilus TaxID=143495 RepID=UPI002E246736|nr:glycosyltransferase family A protein [Aneurinibacillus thermoaerophilus]MED0735892.1 glycosyltransferase family A protein [Aneurinibacillus thermoaerophilus]MED0762801.1 glycosyltransferase family A protein [Aneurinibacillus thermoaerophilus]